MKTKERKAAAMRDRPRRERAFPKNPRNVSFGRAISPWLGLSRRLKVCKWASWLLLHYVLHCMVVVKAQG